MASSTRLRVAPEMGREPVRTQLTVDCETPARRATSWLVGGFFLTAAAPPHHLVLLGGQSRAASLPRGQRGTAPIGRVELPGGLESGIEHLGELHLAAGVGGAYGRLHDRLGPHVAVHLGVRGDRKSTRLNSSHVAISYAVFCLKKKNK